MRAYWYDNKEGDQRLSHDSNRPVTEDYLRKLGIIYKHLPPTSPHLVDEIAKARNYKNRDTIVVSPAAMGEIYEEKVKMFFNEHLHEDEEIRYILDGEGYFDVRSDGDEWVRVKMELGDLLVLPAGIYHRFTTDETNYIKALRLFQDEPKWTALNRAPELDENPHRKNYIQNREHLASTA
ncbi:MAG: 1,2-dihydroxy-3-keto-5-methylthiopentene dioxygenase [Cirrosporium novae-zelandiae]|nr:MAG: 1,2-dihydroxy-3-keto-5-methylthiopentene dioxygenase [Cirrosporium novae-zelandiae]